MISRTILIAVALLFIASTAHAETVLRGNFEQARHLQGFPSPLRSSGSFVLEPSLGLIWRVAQPIAVASVITPNGLIQIISGNDPIRVPASSVPFIARFQSVLSAAMTSNFDALASQFTIQREDMGGGEWLATLMPRADANASNLPFSRIDLQGHTLIEKATLYKPNGDRDVIEFHDQDWDNRGFSGDETKLIRQTAE